MTDYLLAGAVRLRLVDESSEDRAGVFRDVGLCATAAEADRDLPPDVEVRFVDRLALADTPRYLGLHAAYTADAFLLLPHPHARSGRTLFPMDAIGARPVLVTERGAPGIPFLTELLNAAALTHDLLPLHAAGVSVGDVGMLVLGWAKGGKTETVLSLLGEAEVIGDEWVYASADGRAVGMPHPVRLWRWHLAQVPALRRSLPLRTRVRLRLNRVLLRGVQRVPVLRAGAPGLAEQDGAFASLSHVAGDRYRAASRIDRIVFVESHQSDEVRVEPVSTREVLDRMLSSLQYERRGLIDAYHAFRFAFPHRRNSWLEQVADLERDLLRSRLSAVPALRLVHPYPVELRRLRSALLASLPGPAPTTAPDVALEPDGDPHAATRGRPRRPSRAAPSSAR